MEERWVQECNWTFCLNGHGVPVSGPSWTLQVRHPRCGEWTWKDGNYCVRCGGRLERATEAKP